MKLSALALALAAATAVGQTPLPKPIPHGDNVVFGRVLDQGTDAPIAGAVVTLIGYFGSPDRPPDRIPDSLMFSHAASAPRSVLTTGEGYFLFRDLPAGRYSVAATAFGYQSNTYPLQIVEVTDSERPASASIRLWKHGSISGTVVDERGEPVAGVPVTALRRRVAGGGLVLRYDSPGVETDDRGAYRIAELPPGHYVIGVLSTMTSLPAGLAAEIGTGPYYGPAFYTLLRAGARATTGDGMSIGDRVLQQAGPSAPLDPDGRLLVYANALSPGTSSAGEATVVTLGSGESRAGVDVAIRFTPAVRVSGVATGPGGPIGGLAVRLAPASGADTIDAYTADFTPAGVATAVTDAAGAFTFPAVSPGAYMLRASLVAEATQESAAVSVWAAQPLAVGDEGVSGLSIVLQPGIRVRGRIEFRGGPAPALSAMQPIVVGLRPTSGAGIWRTVAARVTSGTTFATGGDPPGRYIVYTSQAPDFGWTLESVSRGTKVLADDILDLDEEVRDLVVTYTRKPPVVSGSIADGSGAPDTGAWVVVFPADSTSWREGVFSSRRIRRMPATSAAAFQFTGLAPGDYYIAAVSARFMSEWDDPVFLERVMAGATTFTLAPGADTTLALKTIAVRER
jgi:protocatechuate 3,4-dioxygenase beta subunit